MPWLKCEPNFVKLKTCASTDCINLKTSLRLSLVQNYDCIHEIDADTAL